MAKKVDIRIGGFQLSAKAVIKATSAKAPKSSIVSARPTSTAVSTGPIGSDKQFGLSIDGAFYRDGLLGQYLDSASPADIVSLDFGRPFTDSTQPTTDLVYCGTGKGLLELSTTSEVKWFSTSKQMSEASTSVEATTFDFSKAAGSDNTYSLEVRQITVSPLHLEIVSSSDLITIQTTWSREFDETVTSVEFGSVSFSDQEVTLHTLSYSETQSMDFGMGLITDTASQSDQVYSSYGMNLPTDSTTTSDLTNFDYAAGYIDNSLSAESLSCSVGSTQSDITSSVEVLSNLVAPVYLDTGGYSESLSALWLVQSYFAEDYPLQDYVADSITTLTW